MTKGCNPEPGQPFELWEDRYRVNVLIGAAPTATAILLHPCRRLQDGIELRAEGHGPLDRPCDGYRRASAWRTRNRHTEMRWQLAAPRHRPRPAGGTPPTVPGAGDTLQPTVESDSMNTDERQSGGSAQPHGKQ